MSFTSSLEYRKLNISIVYDILNTYFCHMSIFVLLYQYITEPITGDIALFRKNVKCGLTLRFLYRTQCFCFLSECVSINCFRLDWFVCKTRKLSALIQS